MNPFFILIGDFYAANLIKKGGNLILYTLRNCLNFIDDKCYEQFSDDCFACDEAHSGVLCNEEQVGKALKRTITELFNKF